ncbi:MAG: hypothetical protein KGS10_16180 [Chloroflexi bacterium]|nr:hypothetical protein [Chloroflexota bacterium]
MADPCTFKLSINAKQSPPAPFSCGVSAKAYHSEVFPDGNLSSEVKAIYGYEATLAGSATLAIDLTTALDRYGAALAADDLAMLLVENVDDGTGTGVLELRPGAGNGLNTLLGASSAVKIPLGSLLVFGSFDADVIDVNATNRIINVVETSGQPTKVRVQAWVRR